jgi:hypothetical protein
LVIDVIFDNGLIGVRVRGFLHPAERDGDEPEGDGSLSPRQCGDADLSK